MSHEANASFDGFWEIRQDMETKRITLIRQGEVVKMIQPGRILTLDELHETLVKERAEMTAEGV